MARFAFLRALLACCILLVSGCSEEPRGCSVVLLPDGSSALTCPGGSVRLPPLDEEAAPGSIEGVARYFGSVENAGIEVRLQGTERVVTTGPDGRYRFDGIAPGTYDLRFDAPGYEPAEIEGLMVLPGTHLVAGEVDLRIGRRLLSGSEWQLLPSPRRDRFLALESGGAGLYLVDPMRLESRRIASSVQQTGWSPDGASFFTIAASGSQGQSSVLLRYDVDRERIEEIADGVDRWELSEDGETLLYRRATSWVLETLHLPSGRHAVVSADVLGWLKYPSQLFVQIRAAGGGRIVAWDLSAAAGAALETDHRRNSGWPYPSEDGRLALFHTPGSDTMLWDGLRREMYVIAAGRQIANFSFAPGSDGLLVLDQGVLTHWDLEAGTPFEIARDVYRAVYLGGGERVAYVKLHEDSHEIFLWNAATRASTHVASAARAVGPLAAAPTGDRIFWIDEAFDLYEWSGAGLRLIAQAISNYPLFHPDGSSYLLYDGTRLRWSSLDGSSTILLSERTSGIPGAWSPSGRYLLFTVEVDESRFRGAGYGLLHLFDRDTLETRLVGSLGRGDISGFVAGDALLLLHRFDTANAIGELARWRPGDAEPVPIGEAVRHGYRATAGGKRLFFRTDAVPVREPYPAALWDDAVGQTVPVDAWVTDQALADEWIAWVSGSNDQTRAGVWVSHYPRELPPPPPTPSEEEEGAR